MVKGIIGKKVGMTQLFDENGKVIPVTTTKGSRTPFQSNELLRIASAVSPLGY